MVDHKLASCPHLQVLIMMTKPQAVLSATLLAALLATAMASTPRRLLGNNKLQDSCTDSCTATYNDNVQKCIADTDLGQPPVIGAASPGYGAMPPPQAYVKPQQTAMQLAESKCRDLQAPELKKCTDACNKPATPSCAQQCDDSFGAGKLLAAWCRKAQGC